MVTDNHYRWDFIGLSTDSKPTPATSEKVVDGSTFYCADNSKLYVFCGEQWYEKEAQGGELPIASAETLGGVKVGDNLSINSETGVLSADAYTLPIASADTLGGVKVGTGLSIDSETGELSTSGGGGGVTVVQTTGTSTTDVMSQNAVSSMIFRDPETRINIRIGENAAIVPRNVDNVAIGHSAYANSDDHATSIGASSKALSFNSVALGYDAQVAGNTSLGAVAIGAYSGATAFDTPLEKGQVHIGSRNTAYGYNSSNYRLLSGVYDPQTAHDASTKGYVDNAIINGGTTAPTTATVGSVGTLYSCVNSGTPEIYMCTAVSGSIYTWTKII